MGINVKSLAITATETAAPLSAADLWVADFKVLNNDATNPCYLGSSTVTTSNGWCLKKGENTSLSGLIAPTNTGDRRINLKNVYVVCAAGQTADVRVLYTELVS